MSRLAATSATGTRLPATRELQRRFHISALTAQRVLATLASRNLVRIRPGRGTFSVGPQPSSSADFGWQTITLGSRADLSADLERLLAPTPPATFGLASTYLEERLTPRGLLAAAGARAARREHGWRRSPIEGVEELRGYFAGEAGAAYRAEHVLVTPGGQAALATICRCLARPEAGIIVESPTYLGALCAARAAGLRLVPVPTDADGVLPDALRDALDRTNARLVYLQPRHANPTGSVLAADRRAAVLDAVRRAGAFLIEDDWVRDLDLDGPTPPPLAQQDEDGHVIYLRSLTKPVAAGLRVAALVARGPALARLRRGRVSDDLFVSPLLQHTALDVLSAPGWPRHLAGLRRELRTRRDVLIAALRQHVPQARLERTPSGGCQLWLTLPDGVDDERLAADALRRDLAVSPGRAYFAGEPTGGRVRLSYAAADSEALRAAAALLAEAIAEQTAART